MVYTQEVATNVFLIDDELYNIPRSGSVYFLAEEKKALIDTGPSTSSDIVLLGIRQIGSQAEEIDYVILTHIHLDHAGGAGTLLKAMPRATVLAHPRALKHLVDPSKLVNSAIQAQGDEDLKRNGPVISISPDRVQAVHEGDRIYLSDAQNLQIMECPGHAPHEICVLESRNRGIFVGDAVGHIVEGTDVILPVTPPPSFDLDLYLKSLQRLKKLQSSIIYFAHAGASRQTREKLEAAERELLIRDKIISQAFSQNRPDIAAQKVIEHVREILEVIKKDMRAAYDYWLDVDVAMSAAEHVRYFQKKHLTSAHN
jgi:glyoxylase-like metal-dependent hydrolase (beta-lactamase superfamily II)